MSSRYIPTTVSPEKKEVIYTQRKKKPSYNFRQIAMFYSNLTEKALGEAVDTDSAPPPLAAGSRDVDLRIPPPGLMKDVSDSSAVVASSVGLPIVAPPVTSGQSGSSTVADAASAAAAVVTTAIGAASPTEAAIKKRPSNSKLEEPSNKKSRSEKIDM